MALVSELKVGSVLMLGAYAPVGNESSAPRDIAWIKANVDNTFVSVNILDILPFDARERGDFPMGNPNWNKSNLKQFLNSACNKWYSPSTELDCPPDYDHVSHPLQFNAYVDHPGFLSSFDNCEISAITGEVSLLKSSDLRSMPLFKRRAKKAIVPPLLFDRRGVYTQYFPYWVLREGFDGELSCAYYSSSCEVTSRSPAVSAGVRPKIMLRPDVEVESSYSGDVWRFSGSPIDFEFIASIDEINDMFFV